MIYSFSELFKIGKDILRTTVDRVTNSITAQIGDVVSNLVESNNSEWWQHIGFASRPSNPVAGKSAAQTIAITGSENDICIASKDVRGQSIYGNLQPGETCIYASGKNGTSQGRILLKDDGSINIVTNSNNTEDGKTVMLRVSPTEILLSNEFGAICINENGLQLRSKNGAIVSLKDETTGTSIGLVADKIAVTGGSVGIGANPLPTNTACFGPGGAATAPSTSVFLSN